MGGQKCCELLQRLQASHLAKHMQKQRTCLKGNSWRFGIAWREQQEDVAGLGVLEAPAHTLSRGRNAGHFHPMQPQWLSSA